MTITYRGVKGQAITAGEYDATVLDLDTRPTGQVYSKGRDIGIKVDTDAPDWGWEDMQGQLFYEIGSPTEPTFDVWNGSIKKRRFDINDEGFITLHVTHKYAMGTDVFFHIHWSHNSGTVTSGAPVFAIEGTYAKGHNQAAFGTPISFTISEPASTTKLQHMVTEVQMTNAGGTGGLIDTADIEVDGIFELRFYLASNTMDGGATPFVHMADGHNQETGVTTKQRTPDFWT